MIQELEYPKIIEGYQSGKSQRQIASEYNTCHKTIKRILSKNNVLVRPRSMLIKTIPKDLLEDLYVNQKKSISEISRLIDSHHNVIKKNLIRISIPIRDHDEQLAITRLNLPSFQNKLNKLKEGIEKDSRFFYALGAFKGDGYYNLKRERVQISVIDLDFLEEIKRIFNLISPETKIEIKVTKEETKTTKKLYRIYLYLHSTDFFNKGLYKLIPQTIQEKIFYLKGLYDAEGCAHIDKNNKLTITLSQKNIKDLTLWESWLNELGIQTSISLINYKGYKWGVIRILGDDSKIKFNNLIGFRIKRKQERLEQGIEKIKFKGRG